jgi:transposase
MTQARVEVITSVQRRRRWSAEEKQRIVAATLEPGAVASAVAREAGVHTSQVFRWRRQLCGPRRGTPDFAAVAIAPPVPWSAPPPATPLGLIEIEFAMGARMRITGAADSTTVSATIAALRSGERRR